MRTDFASVPPVGPTNLDYTSNTVFVSMYERYLEQAVGWLVVLYVGLLFGDHGPRRSVLENDVDPEVGEGVFTQG